MPESLNHTAAFEKDDGAPNAPGPGASVIELFGKHLPSLRTIQLREPVDGEAGAVERPNSREMPAASTTGRYQVFGEIARGGMGAVLRGRDPDLGRDIAIKVLREDHRDNPKMIERFIEEAQIGGQLQHPGIVPVYELNQFTDCRPYFTMKLVKGRTLAALFADCREVNERRARFLSVFAQMAQTVAYAHSRGIIHRDLKPANIMVGNFGEVQVMDWGLAKVLPAGGIADEERSQMANRSRAAFAGAVSEIRTLRSSGSGSDTVAGSLLGTPAYMSPEQARGDTDLIDERSDVFGLGAILCELLTGKPPFTGETPAEVQRKAGLGQLDDAMTRLNNSGADFELIDLTKRCLAAEPWDRPRDAKMVADAAEAYLAATAKRLQRAEQDRAVAEARTIEERKRRRVALALAASVLLTLGLGGATAWWWNDRKVAAAREAEFARAAAIQAVERGLAEAIQFRDQGRWVEAQFAARKAEDLLPPGSAGELRKTAADLRADLGLLIALDEQRFKFAGERDEFYDANAANVGYSAAFREYGVDVEALDPAIASQRFSDAIREPVAEAIDHWAQLRSRNLRDKEGWRRLIIIAQAVDLPNPWRQQLRTQRLNNEKNSVYELAKSPDRINQPPVILVALARNLRDVYNDGAMAYEVLSEVRLRHPGDFWINFELGETCMRKLARASDAVRYFNAALVARPQNIQVMMSIAWAQGGVNDLESEAICRRVIQMRPNFDWPHGQLGHVLLRQERVEESIAASRTAIRLNPKGHWWMDALGQALRRAKKLDEAEAAFRQGLTIVPDYEPILKNLAELLQEQGRKPDLEAIARDAVARQPDVLDRHSRLAEQSHSIADFDAAIACFRRMLPDKDKAPNLAMIRRLATALDRHGRKSDAVSVWRETVERWPDSSESRVGLAFLSREPADLDAAVAALRNDVKANVGKLADHHRTTCALLRIRRDFVAAEAAAREAVRVAPDDAKNYRELNTLLTDLGRRSEAVEILRGGLQKLPDNATLQFDLGNQLYEVGRADEAVGPLQRSVYLNANDRFAWNLLGFARFRQGDFAGARDAMMKARDADKRTASQYDQRIRDMSRLAELAVNLSVIINGTVEPQNPADRVKFAQACHFRGLLPQAIQFYRDAFIEEPKLATAFDLHQAACGAIRLSTQTNGATAAAARRQAFEWLRSDLPRVDKLMTGDNRQVADARRWLNRWQQDENLNPVRESAALAKLPADERSAWERYWKDLQERSAKLQVPEASIDPSL